MPSLILFDGVCNLCESTVAFVAARDKAGQYYYAPLQSDLAQAILAEQRYPGADLDSVLLYQSGRLSEKSTAILTILNDLGPFWRLVSWLRVLPVGFRDWVYDHIGQRRYRWFGKKSECMVPTDELKSHFLQTVAEWQLVASKTHQYTAKEN